MLKGEGGCYCSAPAADALKGIGALSSPVAGHAIAITHLHPLLQLLAVAEDLHARLGVWVVRGLEAQCGQAQAGEELVEHADEVAQGEAAVADEA